MVRKKSGLVEAARMDENHKSNDKNRRMGEALEWDMYISY
jgi:hypothetical protein